MLGSSPSPSIFFYQQTIQMRIRTLKNNEIFVFGSNLAGRHGKGAALIARENFGAVRGVGAGPTGQCFAIPTKDRNLNVLPLEEIEAHVRGFLRYANANPRLTFLLTAVGTGLAGYSAAQIKPFFKTAPPNVVKPPEFL
jgi:hypothetical protein